MTIVDLFKILNGFALKKLELSSCYHIVKNIVYKKLTLN